MAASSEGGQCVEMCKWNAFNVVQLLSMVIKQVSWPREDKGAQSSSRLNWTAGGPGPARSPERMRGYSVCALRLHCYTTTLQTTI